MKKYVIKLNGRTYEVEMGEVGSVETVGSIGTSGSIETVSSGTHSKSPASAGPVQDHENAVLAPMPGNILNVLVQPGAHVKKNQVVLVLEAMKMENEIVAPKDGKIISIHTTKGSTVNASEPLFTMG